jgi:PAS domain S-box-containing protein
MDLVPTVILIINHLDSSYEYCSKNIKNLIGYTSEEMLTGGMALGTSLLYEDQTQEFTDYVIPAMFENMELHRKNNDLKKIRLSYNFKTKRKDGTIVWILQHMSIIDTDDTGGAMMSLVSMTDVTAFKKDNSIDFSVSKMNDVGYFEPVFTSTFPSKSDKVVFTRRELDIIALMDTGHSSIEIAHKLFISVQTVSTHRKNIRKKLRATDTPELFNTLKMKGLLNNYHHPNLF